MTLKNKIKSFFNVDIEKDLKEEEKDTKKFESIKLFKINRNNLILSILIFLVVINLFLLTDFQAFYIRAVLAFLFIILVPGLLIMLMLKIKVGFWEYLVYTIGLSIAFIMFAGLAVNWTLPALGITDKPLSLYPILLCFDIFLIVFAYIAYKRNKDLNFQATFPKLDTINRIFFIIPILFPFMAVLGAFILNNFGPNYLTMIMLGMIAVYVFLLVLLRKRLNPNIYPWALWLIGLSLLLMFSMRSWYIIGGDIISEYRVFQFTKTEGYWSLAQSVGHAYNSMLSLTILPTILSLFNSTDAYLYKIFIGVVYSLSPVILFLVTKRILGNILSFNFSFFIFLPPHLL